MRQTFVVHNISNGDENIVKTVCRKLFSVGKIASKTGQMENVLICRKFDLGARKKKNRQRLFPTAFDETLLIWTRISGVQPFNVCDRGRRLRASLRYWTADNRQPGLISLQHILYARNTFNQNKWMPWLVASKCFKNYTSAHIPNRSSLVLTCRCHRGNVLLFNYQWF